MLIAASAHLPDDPRGARLRAVDRSAADLRRDYRERFEAGDAAATADLATLTELARVLASDLSHWCAFVARLHGSVGVADPGRFRNLVVETVFDDLISPAALHLLAAAVDLAQCR